MSDTMAIQAHLEPILEILQEYVLQDAEGEIPQGFDSALESALEESRFLQLDTVTESLERVLELAGTERPDVQELLPLVFTLQDAIQTVSVEIQPETDRRDKGVSSYLQWDAQTEQEEVLHLNEHEQFLLDGALSRGLLPYVIQITLTSSLISAGTVIARLEEDLSLLKTVLSGSRDRIAALLVDNTEPPLLRILSPLMEANPASIRFESRPVDATKLNHESGASRSWYRDLPPLGIQLEASALDRMRFYISRLETTAVATDQPMVRELARTLETAVSVNLRDLVDSLRSPLEEIARRERKSITLSFGGTVERVPAETSDVLREALRELLVNAIVHGIELPGERAGAGKPERGVIRVFGSMEEHLLTVRVTDDGRGYTAAAEQAAGDSAAAEHATVAPTAADNAAAEHATFVPTAADNAAAEHAMFVPTTGGLGRIQKLLRERFGGTLRVRSGARGTSSTVSLSAAVGGWTGLLCSRQEIPFVVPTVLTGAVVAVGPRDTVNESSGGRFLRYRDRQLPLVEPHEDTPVSPVTMAIIVTMLAGEFALALDGEPREVSVVPDGPGTVAVPEKNLEAVTVANLHRYR